jgi:hypothetical protein
MKIALQPGLPEFTALESLLKNSAAQPQTAAKLAQMCLTPDPQARFITAYDRERLVGFGCWSLRSPGETAEIDLAVDPSYADREISGPMRKLLVPAKPLAPASTDFQTA